jgi:hypothetical protein
MTGFVQQSAIASTQWTAVTLQSQLSRGSLATGRKQSLKQEQLIAALPSHPTVEATAKSIAIGDKTGARWMMRPGFQAAYWESRRRAMRQNHGAASRTIAESVAAFREIGNTKSKRSASDVQFHNKYVTGKEHRSLARCFNL